MYNQAKLLQANNLISNSTSDCDYLQDAVYAWLLGTASEDHDYALLGSRKVLDVFVLWAQLLPVRCDWQRDDGIITWCSACEGDACSQCTFWNETLVPPDQATPDYFAEVLGVRVGGILEFELDATAPMSIFGQVSDQLYTVKIIVDESDSLTFS